MHKDIMNHSYKWCIVGENLTSYIITVVYFCYKF